jgi:AraC family ethanolamine operon transcriptional activator
MFHIGADHPANWLSVTIPSALIDSWFAPHEYGTEAHTLSRSFTGVATTTVASLVGLTHRLFAAAARPPGDLEGRATLQTARHEMVDMTLRTVLPTAVRRQAGRPAIDRQKILSRALSLIEAAGDEPVFTQDLCRTTGVSERTLRNVFNETFGMGPHRYLLLARLTRARAAIRSAHPGQTLANICTDIGFWDFGQFARHYRQVFGVLPSEALTERRRMLARQRLRQGRGRCRSVIPGYSPNRS